MKREFLQEDIKALVSKWYEINVDKVIRLGSGAGSETYLLQNKGKKYILKFPEANKMNNPQYEVEICDYLNSRGMAVSSFIKNNKGEYLSHMEGMGFHLQKYIEGENLGYHEAADWLLCDMACTLGKIHKVLKENKCLNLPTGIGQAFFQYMTPKKAEQSYRNSLGIAEQYGEREVVRALKERFQLIQDFPEYDINVAELTCMATHGDYGINQLICGKQKICAVIDWTSACIHPVVWEIMRSYVYADPRCKEGCINIEELCKYITQYLEFNELTKLDILMMPKLFHYQIAVCDYYAQYYGTKASNRKLYLYQADFSTKMMKWFDLYMEELIIRLEREF